MSDFWRKCSICSKEISFKTTYQECSVSTCKKNVYCSVECWEVHVPILNHKSSFAEEALSPSLESRKRIIVQKPSKSLNEYETKEDIPKDVLIVASKLKNYVKAKHGLNTSANVMEKLSDIVRDIVDQAIVKAKSNERKTLMNKDF